MTDTAAQRPRRIVLIGLSGSGKSTVARLVARRLGWECGDGDDLLVSLDGRPISQIFREEGEEHFRRLEGQAVAQLVRADQMVIATGGGAVLLAENRRMLWQDALVVWLQARPVALLKRVTPGGGTPDSRPLLGGDDPLTRLQALSREREQWYALADWTISTDTLPREAIAVEVVRVYERHGAALTARAGRRESLEIPAAVPEDPDVAVSVQTPSGRYGIVAGWGTLESLGRRLKGLGLSGRISLVSDDNVAALHGEAALATLRRAGFDVSLFRLRPGEDQKTLAACGPLYDWLVGRRAERGEAIVALGGGVVTDLAGFVAATYLRGVPLVHVPTSLLGAMDAAIGGKVAVDHPLGKNLIGAFYQPRLVLIDGALLPSLPPRELTSGWAEVIKHALIADPELLEWLERQVEAIRALDPEALLPVLRRSVQIKARVVSADERESGPRRTLNYGHTIGHALEAVTGYASVLHGEAVAVGMAGAGEISRRLGLLSEADLARQNALLAAYGLPLTWPGIDAGDVVAATARDKKVSGAAVRWVFLEGIGRTVSRADVPDALVHDVVAGLVSTPGSQPRPAARGV